MKDINQYSLFEILIAYAVTMVVTGFFVTLGVIFAFCVTGFRF